MNRLKQTFVIFFLSTVLVSCCKVIVTEDEIPCDLPSEKNTNAVSENFSVDFYIDGTPSMQGYVTDPSSSYIKTLNILDDTFPAAQYYRLGQERKLLESDQHRTALRKEFYNGSSSTFPLLEVVKLEKAILLSSNDVQNSDENLSANMSGNKVTTIITDLYQREADINAVTKALKINYLNSDNPDIAISVVAISSQFTGKIYDIGRDGSQMNWDGDHPFYLVSFGHYQHIQNHHDTILKRLSSEQISDIESVIFAPNNAVEQISYLKNPTTQLPKRYLLQVGNLCFKARTQNSCYQLLEGNSQDRSIQHQVDFYPINNTLSVDEKSIDFVISAQIFDREDQKFKLDENFNSTSSIEIENLEILEQQKKINIQKTIKPGQFAPGIYLITVEAKVQEFQEQEWWQEWNSDDSNLLDGSKTHNLLAFLRSLKNSTEELIQKNNNANTIGRFCYAIAIDR